jgi:hypothetical protein
MTSSANARTLVIHSWKAGFFSNFNGVLNNLRYLLGRDGIEAALVDWHAEDIAYGRTADGNLWLHFFEPIRFERFPVERTEVRMFAEFSLTGINAYSAYKLDREWRQIYHALFCRYIRIRPALLTRVETLYRAKMAGRYCIGVHYRSPTHSVECPNPIPPPDAFIARIRRMLPKGRSWVVVLATDAEPAVPVFERAFGDSLVIQPDVVRAATLNVGPMHPGSNAPSIALGEQVLIDCLLLSRCDVFLHITSNIATAVGYINPDLKMVYCETLMQAAGSYLRFVRQRWRGFGARRT